MFEWDRGKARLNEQKHGIAFPDTFGVFDDPYALTVAQFEDGEDRYVTIGVDAFVRMLVVVYTWRDDNVRIISARRATLSEVRRYESEL